MVKSSIIPLFELVDNWMKLPMGLVILESTSVAIDSNDTVYVAGPTENPVSVFSSDGTFLRSWGKGYFTRLHNLFIDKDDFVYCVDDDGHNVLKFNKYGQLVFSLGTKDIPSDTGCTNKDFRTIKQVAPPFCYPSGVAVSSSGFIYVSDGYCNARVHKFSPTGEFILSWGEIGTKDGQFNLPHAIAIDSDDKIYIADRENNRIQIFNEQGKFLGKIDDVHRPDGIYIDKNNYLYVTELGDQIGNKKMLYSPQPDGPWSTVAIYDNNGKLISRFGEREGWTAGNFFSAHGISLDSHGDMYVSEVIYTCLEGKSPVPGCHNLQKFKRINK